ncbi:MAG: hypothetical protein ABMA64_06035 [Myxococcota bacterium]
MLPLFINLAHAEPATLPAASCGQPICDDQLLASLPESLGRFRATTRQTYDGWSAAMGIPPNGVVGAHGTFTLTGEMRPGEPVLNVNIQWHSHDGMGAPTHVESQPAGTRSGSLQAGRETHYFAIGDVRAHRASWITGGGDKQSQIDVLLGTQLSLELTIVGEHDLAEGEKLLEAFPLAALDKLGHIGR